MNNVYGIKNIKTKGFLIQTPSGDTMMDLVNYFLEEHDGRIIDITFQAQSLGQVLCVITYQHEENINETK